MDLASMKISNFWILCSLAAGLVFSLSGRGQEPLSCLAGILLPVFLLGWMFYFRLLGAGDIKLFCVLGGIMGGEAVLSCIVYAFLAGAAVSLAVLVSIGGFRDRISYFLEYFSTYLSTGNPEPYRRKGPTPENIHFSIPVFMSVMLYAGGIY